MSWIWRSLLFDLQKHLFYFLFSQIKSKKVFNFHSLNQCFNISLLLMMYTIYWFRTQNFISKWYNDIIFIRNWASPKTTRQFLENEIKHSSVLHPILLFHWIKRLKRSPYVLRFTKISQTSSQRHVFCFYFTQISLVFLVVYICFR